jgi:hypothetical protein
MQEQRSDGDGSRDPAHGPYHSDPSPVAGSLLLLGLLGLFGRVCAAGVHADARYGSLICAGWKESGGLLSVPVGALCQHRYRNRNRLSGAVSLPSSRS